MNVATDDGPVQIRLGCQTFTWEMLGTRYTKGPDRLLDMIAGAGYAGIEITDKMIGHYAQRPEAFGRALGDRGLTLVAFAFGSDTGFTEPEMLSADLARVDRALAFVAAFSGVTLSLGSATVMSPGPRLAKFAAAAAFYNAAGERGSRSGVPVALHPSSHHNTLLATRHDYDEIFARTDPALVGWVPDTGHILRGHQDILDTLRTYLDRIRYLHLKDVDGSGGWAMLGKGVCNLGAVTAAVRAAPKFNGWMVLEEESAEAEADPEAAVKANLSYMKARGIR